jgi:hypothetical protein
VGIDIPWGDFWNENGFKGNLKFGYGSHQKNNGDV